MVRASPRDARAHYELSRAYIGRGRMREGAAELEIAIRLDPRFLPAYHALQKYYRLTGRLDLELDILRRLAALHTRDPQSYVRLGQINLGLYWLDDSNQAFQQALLLAPNDPSVLRETAKCDWASGRSEEAVRRLQEARRLAPDDAETTSFLAQYLLATGRAPEAEVVLREALKQRPDDRLLTPVLIFNLVHQGGKHRFQEAVGLSQGYLRTNPPTAAVYCWLGRAYDGLDMPAEAEAAYQNSVRLDPSFENATYLLGRSYLRQGRTKQGQRLISFYAQISSHLQTYVHAEE
ncbi:MAG TPA: tetratricopeptide repeat protein, partial [Chthonomonadaceae bacterium]|nr:tetratricopeptide repeat protein [Chthonomonadaceae bacterium]